MCGELSSFVLANDKPFFHAGSVLDYMSYRLGVQGEFRPPRGVRRVRRTKKLNSDKFSHDGTPCDDGAMQNQAPVNAQYIQHLVDAMDAFVSVHELPYNPASDRRVRDRVKAVWEAESNKTRTNSVQSVPMDIDCLQNIVALGLSKVVTTEADGVAAGEYVPWRVQTAAYLAVAFFTGLRSDEVRSQVSACTAIAVLTMCVT